MSYRSSYSSPYAPPQDRSYTATYVPGVDDIIPPSQTTVDMRPAPSYVEPGLGLVVMVANVLVTIIIVAGMWLDSRQTGRAILSGALYFGLTTPIYVSLITGALPAMLATWQRERTERHRLDAYADLAELNLRYRLRVERNALIAREQAALPVPAADPLPTPADPTSTYVAPYADGEQARTRALAWAASLYQSDGLPDPHQVAVGGEVPGWLRGRMLGSKRDARAREAGIWLLHNRIVHKVEGGYVLDLNRYPTRGDLLRRWS